MLNLLLKTYPLAIIGAFGILYVSCPEGTFALESYSVFFILITTTLISFTPALPLSSFFFTLSYIKFNISSRFTNKFYSFSAFTAANEGVVAFLLLAVIILLFTSAYIWFTDYDCGKYNKNRVVFFLLGISFFIFIIFLLFISKNYFSKIDSPLEDLGEISIPDPFKGSSDVIFNEDDGKKESTIIQEDDEGGDDSDSGEEETETEVSPTPVVLTRKQIAQKNFEKFARAERDRRAFEKFCQEHPTPEPYIYSTPSPEELQAREDKKIEQFYKGQALSEREEAEAEARRRIHEETLETEDITHEMQFNALPPDEKMRAMYELTGHTYVNKNLDLIAAHRRVDIARLNLQIITEQNGDIQKYQAILADAERNLKQELDIRKVIGQQVRNYEIAHKGFSNRKFICICKEKPCSCLNKPKPINKKPISK